MLWDAWMEEKIFCPVSLYFLPLPLLCLSLQLLPLLSGGNATVRPPLLSGRYFDIVRISRLYT